MIVLTYQVRCDFVSGAGRVCENVIRGEGNAIKAVEAARALGWRVHRHDARCPQHAALEPKP